VITRSLGHVERVPRQRPTPAAAHTQQARRAERVGRITATSGSPRPSRWRRCASNTPPEQFDQISAHRMGASPCQVLARGRRRPGPARRPRRRGGRHPVPPSRRVSRCARPARRPLPGSRSRLISVWNDLHCHPVRLPRANSASSTHWPAGASKPPPIWSPTTRDRLAARQLAGGAGEWRVRISDYRIVYEVHGDELLLLVVAISHATRSTATGERNSARASAAVPRGNFAERHHYCCVMRGLP